MPLNRRLSYKFKEDKDVRDYKIHVVEENVILTKNGLHTMKSAKKLASKFTITYLAPILDQGILGDCVCNAAALTISTKTKKSINLSRIMLYALCRINDNTSLDQDVGTTVWTCCDTLKKYGVCQESVCPYNVNNYSTLPSLSVFKSSNLLKNFVYYSINQDLNSLRQCLVSFNQPIIFGIMVYDSFMSDQVASNGIVPMPNTNVETLQGGHCVTMIGYDDTKSWFVCANSWGTSWGNKGIFYLPYAYVLDPNLSSDFYRFTFTF